MLSSLIEKDGEGKYRGFPDSSDGKEYACNAGDSGAIPGLGRSPGEMAAHSGILAWEIPWMEEPPGWRNPWGCKELDMTE